MLINSSSRVPKHMQTAILLKSRITKGEYAPDSKIPTVRMLGAELGVSQNVVQRAIRVLEKEGMVVSQHGVGVRVLDSSQSGRAPLTFGVIHPYSSDVLFAGMVHCLVDTALDAKRNRCIVKSSNHDFKRERDLVEEFIDMGIEGLLVWPCEGNGNVDFFAKIAETTPLVFIDRNLEEGIAPSVVLDYAALGRDVVTCLGSRGYRKTLVLEDPLPISSFREMYSSMKETIKTIGAENRFDFVQLNTSNFVENYPNDPVGMEEQYLSKLGKILEDTSYDALFTVQDEFLDYIFINSSLNQMYANMDLFCTRTKNPEPRSPAFYRRSVYEWVGDFEQVINKASELLHSMVYLRNRLVRQHRIKFTTRQGVSVRK